MRKSSVTRALLLVTAIGLGGCSTSPQTATPTEEYTTRTNEQEVENHGLFP